MKRLRSLFSIAAAAIALSSSASAAALSYTLAGTGTITGTLNGVAFSATSFTITATGDSSNIQSGSVFGIWPGQVNAVSAPSMQINTGSGPINTTLLSNNPFSWSVLALTDVPNYSAYGFIPFANFFSFGTGLGLESSLQSPDFSTHATYSGAITENNMNLSSTGGPLVLSVNGPATFNISAVPEPATATSSLLLSLAGLSLISRRNRKA